MLEAAELLKNDPETLTEGYSKDTYNEVKDDLKALKSKMIKGNSLRIQEDYSGVKEVLTDALEDARALRKKVDKLPDPAGFARFTSATFGIKYVNAKAGVKTKISKTTVQNTRVYSDGSTSSQYSTETKNADTDTSRSFYIRNIISMISALISDIKTLIKFCDEENDTRNLTSFELGIFNGKMLNSKK